MKRKVLLFLSWTTLFCCLSQAATAETVDYFKGQIATIVLPIKPDPSKGRYFKLNKVEYGKICFEEVLRPKARTPYVIVPYEDFSIDPDTLDLTGLVTDLAITEYAGLVGTYAPRDAQVRGARFNYLFDSTPDCYIGDNGWDIHVGRLRAFIWVDYDIRITWKDKTKMEYALYSIDDELLTTFTQDQMATIILPTTPDASRGKYYRLDRWEGNEIIFEQELQPKAHVPYIIVPTKNFCFDVSTMDLEECCRDTIVADGIRFIGSFAREGIHTEVGYDFQIIDTTPDCLDFGDYGGPVIGPLHAYLEGNWDVCDNGVRWADIVLHDYGTGINDIKSEKLRNKDDDAIYDLQGRRVSNSNFKSQNSKLPRGIYIKNGRKIAVK